MYSYVKRRKLYKIPLSNSEFTKHMKRFSKPVYRPTEFLFPTIKVSSDQRKKIHKTDKQTVRPILQT